MAYYGSYGCSSYPGQANSYAGTYPSSYAQTGLAGYGGSTYRVNQPAYYAGPSYSTTSDNDYNFSSLPVAGYGSSGYCGGGGVGGYSSGYGANIGSYAGAQSYPAPNYPAQSYQPQSYPAQSYADPYAYSQQQQQPLQPSYSQAPQSASYSQAQLPQATQQGNDDISQLAPQIEAAYEAATSQRRQPVIKRQVITVPGTPGKVQQVVRRLPTPTPDIVERVFVVKPQRDIVNLVIERPGTPPAQYKDRTVMGKQRRPLINPRIVRVQARSQYQQPTIGYQQSYQQPQYQQYVQALPAPTPQLNVHTVRVPPSSSFQQYAQYGSQTQPSQSIQPQQPQQQYAQQPALSGQQQYPHQLSQGQLSQPSQTQLQPQLSQPQLNVSSCQSKGYLIAPIQYDDGYQQCTSDPQQSYAPQSYGAGYSTGFAPSYYGSTGYPSAYTSSYPSGYPSGLGARVC